MLLWGYKSCRIIAKIALGEVKIAVEFTELFLCVVRYETTCLLASQGCSLDESHMRYHVII